MAGKIEYHPIPVRSDNAEISRTKGFKFTLVTLEDEVGMFDLL